MQLPDIPHPAEALILSKVPPTTIERVRKVRLMAFDVDGVLTDGRLWFSEQGEAMKNFHVLDGHGLKLLAENGIQVALITARQGPIVARRAAELGIDHLHQGVRDKAAALNTLATSLGLTLAETGYMGDDIIDMPALQRAGFAATVPNAPPYMAQVAHWISKTPGGSGAARECCDLILAAQGKLAGLLSASSRLSTLTGEIQ